MSETEDPRLFGGDFIRHLISAWECCATCAGGVLARHDRAIKAKGWDEGWQAAWSPLSPHGLNDGDNPYRAAAPPQSTPTTESGDDRG